MEVREVLSELGADQQRVVTLVYFEHRTIAETAVAMGVEPTTVTSLLTQAFRSVARWTTEDDTDDTAPVPHLSAPGEGPVSSRARAS